MHDQTLELSTQGIDAVFLGSAEIDPNAGTKAFDEHNPASIILLVLSGCLGKKGTWRELNHFTTKVDLD